MTFHFYSNSLWCFEPPSRVPFESTFPERPFLENYHQARGFILRNLLIPPLFSRLVIVWHLDSIAVRLDDAPRRFSSSVLHPVCKSPEVAQLSALFWMDSSARARKSASYFVLCRPQQSSYLFSSRVRRRFREGRVVLETCSVMEFPDYLRAFFPAAPSVKPTVMIIILANRFLIPSLRPPSGFPEVRLRSCSTIFLPFSATSFSPGVIFVYSGDGRISFPYLLLLEAIWCAR